MSSCLSLPGGNVWLMTWWGRKGMLETLKNIYFYWLYLWLTMLWFLMPMIPTPHTSAVYTPLFQGHQHPSLSLYPFQFSCLDNLCVLPLCCFWTFFFFITLLCIFKLHIKESICCFRYQCNVDFNEVAREEILEEIEVDAI